MDPTSSSLAPGTVVRGPLLPEPVEVITTIPMGESVKLVGKGLRTGQVHDPILSPAQVAQLTVSPATEPFDGDAVRFRLGIEAERLALAYEYDPYFSLSIARVDPLPHQLEAVYEYFLPLPRIRFLLADDPGAGKTIMAGLLLKELKIRGLVQRTLIVAPANLTFQWQREMKDKFRETFEVMRGEILRSQYGQNPWQEKNQVVTSVSWISRIEDAKESLLRSRWDLVIVDEAHKMSAYSHEKKTLAFQLGEALSERTDHYLLMTATPHKGDPENFRLFLSLLDPDVYGDVKSLEEAMRRHEAPFYLRRTKEALVSFPDGQGNVHPLFTNRDVRTAKFDLDGEEYDFYDALTRYVEDQSMKAAASDSPQARALGFIMAMLQRRFASSVYAVRRSLERMREKREKILEDPEKYRREQIERRLPDDFDDLTEEEQDEIRDQLEGVVVSIDPAALRDEIQRLAKLIERAKALEAREVESKLAKLREVLNEQNIFGDQRMKLLVFTEHKDTLDYLAGDGRDGRPLGKLREWGLTVTQIHGGHEDRRPGQTRHPHPCRARVPRRRPGPGGDRGRGRGDQPPVLLVHDQLRHPLEPGAARAAHGPHPPLWPDPRLPDFQLRGGEHARGARAAEAPGAPAGNQERARHGQSLRRGGRGVPLEPPREALPRDVRPAALRAEHRGADRARDRSGALPRDQPTRRSRGWPSAS